MFPLAITLDKPHGHSPMGEPLIFKSVMPELGAPSPPIFGRSVNPIPTRGIDSAHSLLLAPSNFFTFRHRCQIPNARSDFLLVHTEITYCIYYIWLFQK